jgi:quinone-modifying oxidoreductase subunit QmoC
MSDLNQALADKYKGNFLKEVIDNVEEGDMVQMCMQ